MLLRFVGEGMLFNHGDVKFLLGNVNSSKGASVFPLYGVLLLLEV